MLGITNYQGNATQNHREISSHTCQDDCYQKAKRYVLVRMQRNGNPCALLVGMQTGTAITENGMKIPSGIYPKEIKSASWRHTHIPMFTVPLLHNGKDMEITQGSINGWMDKENGGWRYTCIYTYICVHTHTHTHKWYTLFCSLKRRKPWHLWYHRWIWRTLGQVRQARHRKTITSWSLLYVESKKV